MAAAHLFIGNKNYSSWSMRPWLALRWAGIPFEETVIPLGGLGYGKSQIPEILAVSPSGRVPALRLGELLIWDSLAICEWAAEQAPDLWPRDADERARARALACEMHSGFAALRAALPMNLRRRAEPRDWSPEVRADLARIDEAWSDALARSGGPFLFGPAPGVADAMFAPVATRLRTYGVVLGGSAMAYSARLLEDAHFQSWEAAAVTEPWTISSTDDI